MFFSVHYSIVVDEDARWIDIGGYIYEFHV